MKKKLLFISAALFLLWMIGYFILGFSIAVHTMLWISVILFVRACILCSGEKIAVAKEDK